MPNFNEMSFDQLVPTNSKYLQKSDVGEDGVILTIKGFTQETLQSDSGDEVKTIMHFVEPDYKPMVLNKTNANILATVFKAQKAGDVVGKQVVVYDDVTISFGGKVTGGLRLKKVAGAPAQPRKSTADKSTAEEFASDVPF